MDEAPKGEVTTVLHRPAGKSILEKAAWFSEYMASAPKKPVRTDVVRLPTLVYEYLKIVLLTSGEAFLRIGREDDEVFGTIMPPGSIKVVYGENGELIGYYEGTLPADGDLSKANIRTYQPEEILHIKGA